MSTRDPYRKLSGQIATAVGSFEGARSLVGLHLTLDEWKLVIEALDRAAKPGEARKISRPTAKTNARSGDGGDITS